MQTFESPLMVKFDEIACCALRMAFEKNQDLIFGFLQSLIPAEKIKQCGDILINTIKIGWVPQQDEMIVYKEAAHFEIDRLKKLFPEDQLSCNCPIKEHMKALEDVINLMGGLTKN